MLHGNMWRSLSRRFRVDGDNLVVRFFHFHHSHTHTTKWETVMEYPTGAFKSIEEFQKYYADGNGHAWEASRKHSRTPTRMHVTGCVMHRIRPNGDAYIYIEIANNPHDTPSVLDRHLMPQSYNDWFLFANEADALAYLATEFADVSA